MADILIRGMEMPKSCEDCPLVEETENFYGDTMLRVCNLIYKGYTSGAPKGRRRADCPLLSLPAGYGRLIDADALSAMFEEPIEVFLARLDLRCPPTIVPAE